MANTSWIIALNSVEMINALREYIFRRFNVSFSKAGDDIQLMKLINQHTPGTYVDVGCWHPKKASNTYHFYVRNWRGICIDPNPELAPLYQKFRPKDTFINCGIGQSDESLDYFMLDDNASSMNTFDFEFIKKHQLEGRIKKTLQIPLYPLSDVLEKNLRPGERLDFFDIDVEGLDLSVLKTNDWNRFRPKVVVVETNFSIDQDITSEVVTYLASNDYDLVGKSIINGNLGNLFLIDRRKCK